MKENENIRKMPLLFIGHGSPVNAIEQNEFSVKWQELGVSLEKPVAILCISAHWESQGTLVTASERPPTIHDFGGFPDELYEVRYPAPGHPGLSNEILSRVHGSVVGLDHRRGLDHGCWCVLNKMFPEADIPVIQISLDYEKDPQSHYNLARELSPLRKNGVLILGSGNMVHNLRLIDWRMNQPGYGFNWALEANGKMKNCILSGDHASLIDFRSGGKAFDLAIPTAEHFLPLLYILAMKEEGESIEFFNDKPVMGSLTMTSVKIG